LNFNKKEELKPIANNKPSWMAPEPAKQDAWKPSNQKKNEAPKAAQVIEASGNTEDDWGDFDVPATKDYDQFISDNQIDRNKLNLNKLGDAQLA
jgi:hypothetical protein